MGIPALPLPIPSRVWVKTRPGNPYPCNCAKLVRLALIQQVGICSEHVSGLVASIVVKPDPAHLIQGRMAVPAH